MGKNLDITKALAEIYCQSLGHSYIEVLLYRAKLLAGLFSSMIMQWEIKVFKPF